MSTDDGLAIVTTAIVDAAAVVAVDDDGDEIGSVGDGGGSNSGEEVSRFTLRLLDIAKTQFQWCRVPRLVLCLQSKFARIHEDLFVRRFISSRINTHNTIHTRTRSLGSFTFAQ